jgi:hypothetical protein
MAQRYHYPHLQKIVDKNPLVRPGFLKAKQAGKEEVANVKLETVVLMQI